MAQALTPAQNRKVRAFGIFEDDSLPAELVHARASAEVEQAAEAVRVRLAPQPVGELVKTPDEMVSDLEFAKWGASRIALVLKHARIQVRDTRKALRESRAKVLNATTARSADLRQAEVDVKCAAEIEAYETAEIVLDFAKDVARAVEQTGSMTQTQAGLVKAQMALAGTGREA